MRFTLIIALFISQLSFSQGGFDSDTNYLEKPNSFSLNVFGLTPIIGITYERYLGKRFMLEIGGGYSNPTFEGGIGYKYFFKKPIKSVGHTNRLLMPHFGLRHSYHLFDDGEKLLSHSIVFGVALFAKNNLNFSFDFGPSYLHTIPDVKNYLNVGDDPPLMYVNFNLKLGYRFGKAKKEFDAKL